MGCKLFKNTDIREHPALKPQFLYYSEPPDWREAQIGAYIVEQRQSAPVLRNLMKWKTFAKHNTLKKFRRRISKGPPVQFRWRSWISFLGVEVDISLYESFALASEHVMHEIDKDLARTFTDHPFFVHYADISQPALRRVLGKFAEKHKDVGYCQGLNSVIGFLLLVSGGSEVEVFFLFEKLCETHGLGDYFKPSMNGLKQQLIMFHNLAVKRNPPVIKHMRREGFEHDYWLVQWIITLCTNRFSLQNSLRIWDNFIVDGEWFIVKLAVAYICRHGKEILKMSLEDLVGFFSSVEVSEDLIKAACKIHIPEKLGKLVKDIYAMDISHEEPNGVISAREDVPIENTLSQSTELESILKNIIVRIPHRNYKTTRVNNIIAHLNKLSI